MDVGTTRDLYNRFAILRRWYWVKQNKYTDFIQFNLSNIRYFESNEDISSKRI